MPCYGSTLGSHFAKSLLELTHLFRDHGISCIPHFLGNESLVTRARNSIANAFLDSDCTHLLFLDVDLEFDPKDILRMLAYSVQKNMELIGLPYSKKGIKWDTVVEAVQKGVPAEELENVTAPVAANFDMVNNSEFEVSKPVEVIHVATGLMLISRSVFNKLADAHPEWKYQLMKDEIHQLVRTTAYAFFRNGIDENTGTYLSEDYAFCNDWRALGGKTWLCPWAKTSHMGTYFYKCDIPTLGKWDLTLRKS